MAEKRKADELITVSKKTKQELVKTTSNQIYKPLKRTSDLSAPIMSLQGHTGQVLTTRFSYNGKYIASGSVDKTIRLWNAFGDVENYGILKGHTGAVIQVEWSRDDSLYSCSSDSSIIHWDLEQGISIKKYKTFSIINSISVSRRGSFD